MRITAETKQKIPESSRTKKKEKKRKKNKKTSDYRVISTIDTSLLT